MHIGLGLVLALVELVADGIASGLDAGGGRCVRVLCNLCEILLVMMIDLTTRSDNSEHTLVDLLGSLSASALDGLGDVVCGVPERRVSVQLPRAQGGT